MKRLAIIAMLFGACVDCGPDVSDLGACRSYEQCADQRGLPFDEATYGPTGTCWSTGVQATEDRCNLQCQGFAADAGCPL